jgi:hypothetical protein
MIFTQIEYNFKIKNKNVKNELESMIGSNKIV